MDVQSGYAGFVKDPDAICVRSQKLVKANRSPEKTDNGRNASFNYSAWKCWTRDLEYLPF